MKPNTVRALAGLGTVVAIAAVIALAVSLFRGSFTETVPVTVISDRAGLVMNPDAKVKMRGVAGGQGVVDRVAARRHGRLHLAMDPSQLHLIPVERRRRHRIVDRVRRQVRAVPGSRRTRLQRNCARDR